MKRTLSVILDWFSKPKNIWVTVFLYTIVTGLFVQFVFLPYIVSSWHAGYGLLKGMDGLKFHHIALRLADLIKQQGWSVWQLRPEDQLVSGIAAIFYVLIYPAPWTVLPLNAALNATSGVFFFLLIQNWVKDRRASIIATVPFIFFPSALLWNTQFHNENYAVPGVIFIFYGWVLIIQVNDLLTKGKRLEAIQGLVFISIGSLLYGWVRRPILTGLFFLFVIASIGFFSIYFIEEVAFGFYWLKWD